MKLPRLRKRKQSPKDKIVCTAIDCILREHQNREAFNRNLSVGEFKEAVNKGELEYYGMTAEEIIKELGKRGFGEII